MMVLIPQFNQMPENVSLQLKQVAAMSETERCVVVLNISVFKYLQSFIV
jgi:hypothetical protein